MNINTLGPVAALTAFLTIWLGHVMVRRVEFVAATLLLPVIALVTMGVLAEYGSWRVESMALKVMLGITGMTLFFDALELLRQQRRVRHGHAPANPNNPRHAAILADPRCRATTRDLLKGASLHGDRRTRASGRV